MVPKGSQPFSSYYLTYLNAFNVVKFFVITEFMITTQDTLERVVTDELIVSVDIIVKAAPNNIFVG